MNKPKSPALIAAEAAQAKLDACLDAQANFRLEAGAGAGKTYSLVAALKKIIAEKGYALMHAGQQVACITYTEVARKEIANDIEERPAILVNTIHGFGWAFISRFQKALRQLVLDTADEKRQKLIDEAGGIHDQRVDYSFGFFGVDEARITLHHDDVPAYLAALLGNPKFQRIFASLYPVLFIDEYQDTDPLVMDALSDHFFEPRVGPITGLFGDHWQTIYRKDYELTAFPHVEGIDKGSNFRSVQVIVDVLNRLRPELMQEVDDPDVAGEARFFHCNSFAGERVDRPHARRELPDTVLADAIARTKQTLSDDGWNFEPATTKILMLTHNVIAAERGYRTLASIYDHKDALVKKEDAVIAFLVDMIGPVCDAYAAGKHGAMFALMGGIPTIRKAADKASWRQDMEQLAELCVNGSIGQVLDHLKETRRPRLPDRVAAHEEDIARLGPEVTEDEPNSLKRYRQLREVAFSEIVALSQFINGFTPFATQHSVKGAEFDDVLVILSGGWNHYNWPKFLELCEAENIAAKDKGGFYRARNLFYVAISRPKRRLAVLATQALSATAMATVEKLFLAENIVAVPLGE
ncbi:DNA helicase II [Gluconobacter potus]|uniref:DNA 3'-5' helicase II n=1 Tax=Gluconobacter potus TaxID=2724927 RepID=A0A149QZP0_9PROT|nr:UvrD-helicase domain-containing protein [Gluconobacter potus]KXV02789.1 DNA helicase II [Gluconobacter potus]